MKTKFLCAVQMVFMWSDNLFLPSFFLIKKFPEEEKKNYKKQNIEGWYFMWKNISIEFRIFLNV